MLRNPYCILIQPMMKFFSFEKDTLRLPMCSLGPGRAFWSFFGYLFGDLSEAK